MPIEEIPPFSLDKEKKTAFLLKELNRLEQLHYNASLAYKNIVDILFNIKIGQEKKLEDIPYLPVQLFKYLELKSIPNEKIFRTLLSSGTTLQIPSKVFLDKETALLQTRALAAIVSSFIGKERMPMGIIDCLDPKQQREAFSARKAGILGFSTFGSDHFYMLDENMELKLGPLQEFLEKHRGKKILLFGFTFVIWKHLYQVCAKNKVHLDFGNSILIHGGGWKKLKDLEVSDEEFKNKLKSQFNIQEIYNYYGMVEQVGCIYMECAQGHLHVPAYSEVIIRDIFTFKSVPLKTPGVIQLLSIIPHSYPGHSILTEDLGECLGEDDCPCGRLGKYFRVTGRYSKAELRGCSDTYGSAFTV